MSACVGMKKRAERTVEGQTACVRWMREVFTGRPHYFVLAVPIKAIRVTVCYQLSKQ